MPIYRGNTKIETIYRGGTVIGQVYKGSTLVYENKLPAGQVLAESSTPGTYTLTIPKTQNYYFVVVGAGGGSAWGGSGHYTNYNAAGGSGACAAGTIKLTKGTVLTYVVGALGANNAGSSVGDYPAQAGGSSAVSIPGNAIATANGGGGAIAHIHTSPTRTPGAGGTYTMGTGVAVDSSITKNGNAGVEDTPGASVYGGWGKGNQTATTNGTNGYVLIRTA